MKFKPIYFLISAVFLSLSAYSILTFGFKYSIDFTGGSVVEYQFESKTTPELVETIVAVKAKDYEVKEAIRVTDNNVQLRFSPDFTQNDAEALSLNIASSTNEKPEVVRFETVGPTLSQEILQKTYIAVALASLAILLWVAMQFKSIKLGILGLLAVVHDLVILLGVFAYLGYSQGIEVDILVVTAMLTIFALSLYDTIVVYDRIRESKRKLGDVPTEVIANRAVSETVVRSLNTSITTSLVLFALFLMGGASIKWFALALLVGIVSGTYSSLFVAVPLLVVWDQVRSKFFKR